MICETKQTQRKDLQSPSTLSPPQTPTTFKVIESVAPYLDKPCWPAAVVVGGMA